MSPLHKKKPKTKTNCPVPLMDYFTYRPRMSVVCLPFALFAGALPPSVLSPYCPPVCMPAAGCKPIRPPGQLLQPLALLQRHQHRQRSPRGHQLLPLQRDLRPQGGRRPDGLPVCGHFPGHRAGSSHHDATCGGATAVAASYYFTHRCVSQKERRGGKVMRML